MGSHRRNADRILALSWGIVGLGFFWSLQAFGQLQASQPTAEVFDVVLRKHWERRNSSFDDPNNDIFIAVQPYPAPDNRSIESGTMRRNWHWDFYTEATPRGREKQIRQLNALVKVGLLEKFNALVASADSPKEALRYRLTDKGWAASGYPGCTPCFIYGQRQFHKVVRFQPSVISNEAGFEVYEVQAEVGLRSEEDLVSWARDQDVQSEFPDIKKSLEANEVTIQVARGGGGWTEFQSMLRSRPIPPHISQRMSGGVHEQDSLLPPTIDEIRSLLLTAYGVGKKEPWPIPCLYLPGAEKLPVDKALFGQSHSRYSVAIFTNKDRAAHDVVVKKTIPMLNLLEELGVLTKSSASDVSGDGKDRGKVFDALVYTLTSDYLDRTHPRHPYCFPLGEPSVEFIDVQIGEHQQPSYQRSIFRYKLRLSYNNPPSWMRDARLLSRWDELRGVLEHGMGCIGRADFDRKVREQRNGGGQCRWAFDSYYENR